MNDHTAHSNRMVQLAKAVLSAAAGAAQPKEGPTFHRFLAFETHRAIEEQDKSAGEGESVCHPDGPHASRRCAWGVVIESMPEGLQASSADAQVHLHGDGLSVAIYRLACTASVGERDTLFKEEL